MSIIDAAINSIKEGQEKGYTPSYVINEEGKVIVLRDDTTEAQ